MRITTIKHLSEYSIWYYCNDDFIASVTYEDIPEDFHYGKWKWFIYCVDGGCVCDVVDTKDKAINCVMDNIDKTFNEITP